MISARPSLPVRGAWVEIRGLSGVNAVILSLPVRGAWVEIAVQCAKLYRRRVAPRAGSVG